jgi:two-component system, OmpR family, phosphate regulon response regulator PhoB
MANPRMLLVEDDPALAELLVWHFTKADFDVRQTPDGEEALILARETPPDIVILDWMIESLSGIEVCRRLRRVPDTANVPIIMLTARGEEDDRIRGLETGADDYVTKPFSPRELVARVLAVLRRVRPALAAEELSYSDIEMNLSSHKVYRNGKAVALGLDAVWGQDSDNELRTVDVHIRRLRKAINEGELPDVIRTVRSAGYALDAEGRL